MLNHELGELFRRRRPPRSTECRSTSEIAERRLATASTARQTERQRENSFCRRCMSVRRQSLVTSADIAVMCLPVCKVTGV